jgi:hypothetical protein
MCIWMCVYIKHHIVHIEFIQFHLSSSIQLLKENFQK